MRKSPSRSRGYARLVEDAPDEDAWAHERLPQPAPPLPAKEIALAVCLLAAGALFLTCSGLIARGRVPGAAPGAGWGLLALGLLAAVPGFYVTRIAYYAARGRPGFSFGDIPRG